MRKGQERAKRLQGFTGRSDKNGPLPRPSGGVRVYSIPARGLRFELPSVAEGNQRR